MLIYYITASFLRKQEKKTHIVRASSITSLAYVGSKQCEAMQSMKGKKL